MKKQGFLSNRLFQIIILLADVVLLAVIIVSISSAGKTQTRPDTQINISVTNKEDPAATDLPEQTEETDVPQDIQVTTPSQTETNTGSDWSEDWMKGGL